MSIGKGISMAVILSGGDGGGEEGRETDGEVWETAI